MTNRASDNRNHIPVRCGQMQLVRGWNGGIDCVRFAHKPKHESANNGIIRREGHVN